MNLTRCLLGSLLCAGSLVLVACGDPVSTTAPLVTGERLIRAIAVDDFYVYWSTQDGSTKRVSRDGGKAETLNTSDQPAKDIAVDETHLYFLGDDGVIERTAKEGGTVEPLTVAGDASGFALDPTNIYFTTSMGTVQKQSKGDGSVVDLAPNQRVSTQFAIDGTSLIWADNKASVNELATNTGAAEGLVVGQKQPALVAISSTNVFWANTGDTTKGEHTVGVARRDGSNVQLIAPPTSSFTSSLMGDDAYVYFGDLSGGVNIAPALGGAATQLAQGPAGNVVMAMDATSIYWAHSEGGTIFSMPRQ